MNKGIVTPQKGLREKENAILRVFAAHLAEARMGGWTSRTVSSSSKTSCFTSSECSISVSKSYTLLFFWPLQLPSTGFLTVQVLTTIPHDFV